MNGNLEAYDFDTTVPAHEKRSRPFFHWDALSTAVQYSRDILIAGKGSLVHGHTVAHFDGGAPGEARWPKTRSVDSHLDVLDADIAEVPGGRGDRPLSGNLGFSPTYRERAAVHAARVSFEVRDGSAYGVDMPSFRGDLKLANDELRLTNLEAKAYNATLAATLR